MDQKPKIPTLKDYQKPQVRIKGLAARLSLVQRLKQFKKKDLAFILAGMGVLFMAPLAEHFMMSPENSDPGAFKPGWGFQGAGNFGTGGSPYESGVNGLAPGSFAGGGGDVITPLNMRDPSALIMGPGAVAQPAATSTTPPAPASASAAKENTDWRDAIANASSKGASAAMKAASLPVPKPSLTNAGLRGLGVASGGGGGAQWAPPPIVSSPHAAKAAQSNSLAYVTKMPGYAGVGARGILDGSANSMAALRNAAANAGSALNRQTSAVASLEQAAGLNMPGGAGNGGASGGEAGGSDKASSGNALKDSKTLGESLAFLAAKENQEHAIDLAWKLKDQQAMLWPNLEQQMLTAGAMGIENSLLNTISNGISNFGGGGNANSTFNCPGGVNLPGSTPSSCAAGAPATPAAGASASLSASTSGGGMVCVKEAGNNYLCGACINGSVSGTMQCQLVQNSPAGGGDSPNAQTPSGNVPGVANGTDMQLDGICSALASAPDKTTPTFQKMIESAQGLAAMKKALVTGKDTASCKGLGPTQYNLPSGTVKQALQNAMAPIVGPAKPNLLDNANQLLTAGVAAVTYAPDADGTQPITAPDATTWKAAWKAFEQGLKGQGQLQDQTQDQTSDQTSSPAQGPAQGQVASANSALATIGQQLQQLTTIRSTVQSDVVWLNGADATFTSNANVANAKDSQGPTMAKQMATYMGQYQGMVDNAQTSYNAVAGQMAAGKGIIPVFVKDMRDLHANTNKFLTGTGDSISVLPSSLGGNPPVNPPVGIKDYNTLVPQPTTTPTADQQTAATNVNSTRDFLAKQQYGSAPAGSAGDLNCVGPSCPGGLAQVSVADLQAINANLNNCPPAAAPGAATALVTPAMPVMTPIAGPVTAADASAQPMSQ